MEGDNTDRRPGRNVHSNSTTLHQAPLSTSKRRGLSCVPWELKREVGADRTTHPSNSLTPPRKPTCLPSPLPSEVSVILNLPAPPSPPALPARRATPSSRHSLRPLTAGRVAGIFPGQPKVGRFGTVSTKSRADPSNKPSPRFFTATPGSVLLLS